MCGAISGRPDPPSSLIAAAATAPLPVHMLVRPRDCSFEYDVRDAAMVAAYMEAAAHAGLAGVVIGATCNGVLDATLVDKPYRSCTGAGHRAAHTPIPGAPPRIRYEHRPARRAGSSGSTRLRADSHRGRHTPRDRCVAG